MERAKAKVSTSQDSSQAFPSTISFDTTIQGSTVWVVGSLSFLMQDPEEADSAPQKIVLTENMPTSLCYISETP